ncbi:MAG: chain-length determining protein [Alphaproteobacteria bacterium]|nr:chain-length determining protein [Alphaproteobacteria bacterium]
MTDPKLTYLGPLPKPEVSRPSLYRRLRKKMPLSFVVVVLLPTVVAAIYLLLIAAPIYVSEARFIVRTPTSQPSALGVALQGVGLSSNQTDAFAVHEYITSRDGLRELNQRYDVKQMLSAAGADPLSRFPRPWEGRSFEDLYRGFQRYVTVGYDATTGINTLRVEAFRPQDSQALASAMLDGGEKLVNRLNERAASDTVDEARRVVQEAESRLAAAQQKIAQFRNREGFIDPVRTASAGSELIGELATALATMRAERSQLAADAPSSPQLAIIDSRIRAYERQIAQEQAKIAGNSDSLAQKLTQYEALQLDVEYAGRTLTASTAAYDNSVLEARRKRLYLERVVVPDLPDKPTEPKRLVTLLGIFASLLLTYAIGWLIYAGVREHQQM